MEEEERQREKECVKDSRVDSHSWGVGGLGQRGQDWGGQGGSLCPTQYSGEPCVQDWLWRARMTCPGVSRGGGAEDGVWAYSGCLPRSTFASFLLQLQRV